MSNNIKKLRKQNKLTQTELVTKLNKISDKRITQATLSRWEKGINTPNKKDWEVLSKIFNVSVPYLQGAYSKEEIIKLYNEYLQKKITEINKTSNILDKKINEHSVHSWGTCISFFHENDETLVLIGALLTYDVEYFGKEYDEIIKLYKYNKELSSMASTLSYTKKEYSNDGCEFKAWRVLKKDASNKKGFISLKIKLIETAKKIMEIYKSVINKLSIEDYNFLFDYIPINWLTKYPNIDIKSDELYYLFLSSATDYFNPNDDLRNSVLEGNPLL